MPANPAETYESYMVPALFAPWAERLIDLARPRPGERVLDVGCGTGVVARRLAARPGAAARITGIDRSPAMLEVARAAADREGHPIAWDEGRAEALPYPDRSFDLVVSQFALMFFADRAAALIEMHRVLAEHGRLALAVWQGLDRHPFYRAVDEAVERRAGMSGVRDIFALGDADALAALLRSAGLRDVELEPASLTARFPDPDGFLAGEIDVDTAAIPSMQHLDDAARRRITDAIRQDLDGALRELTEGDHVVIPFHAHLVRATR
jgi:ubiquinone/menaquinone biosynthesis C-methylase UbiE